MVKKPKQFLASVLLLATLSVAAWAGPGDVPVTFVSTNMGTVAGQSVFVAGILPQIGSWDQTRAIKMVVDGTSCIGTVCSWSVTVALPANANYQYKFIRRNDCATCYGDAGNVFWEPGADRQASTPAGPSAPYAGKTVFYYSGWSNVSVLYSNTATGWTSKPMIPVGPGRGGGEQVWQADGIGSAGETNIQFVFYSIIAGTNSYDNAGRPGVDYQTGLDALVVQDGHIFNYWPPAALSAPRIETFNLTPNNGLAARTIRVYLPRGYDQNTTKRYPVLYMHDGANLFLGMGAFGSWHADTNASNLIRFGKMRETIIVGVDQTNERLREYTPPTCTPPGGGSSLGSQYTSFLITQVKPQIDSTYRTLTDADSTGVLGSSMGGLISAYLGWQQSATFHKIGAFSSSFQVCFPIPTPDTKRPIRVYLDSGDSGASSDNLGLTVTERDNLIRNGYVFNDDLDHTIGYGDAHNEDAWKRRSPRAFTFLFPVRDEPNTVLDTAAPPRITDYQLAGDSNVVTWTSYRLRMYSLEGSTSETFSAGMTWSNLLTTAPEPLPWNYLTGSASNSFRFFRVRELSVPNWPN